MAGAPWPESLSGRGIWEALHSQGTEVDPVFFVRPLLPHPGAWPGEGGLGDLTEL